MPDPPTGAVTFLFTDVEGSTQLVRHLRDAYKDVLATHQRLLRYAWMEHGGHEVDTQGDAFFVAFRRPEHAVLAAVAGQRALAAYSWPGGVSVRVRIGIHTGEAQFADGRYHGLSVHRASRVCAAAHGGQTLVSRTTQALLEDNEAELPGIVLRRASERRLKDFERPEQLYQVDADGLPSEFPPLEPSVQEVVELAPAPGRARRGAAPLILALAALLGIGIVAAIVLLRDDADRPPALARVPPNAVGVIDPEQNELVAQIGVGSRPTRVTVADGRIWVLNADDDSVSQIDASELTVDRTIGFRSAFEASALAASAGSVWLPLFRVGGDGFSGVLARLDPASRAVVAEIPFNRAVQPSLVGGTLGVVGGGQVVWVGFGVVLARIDPVQERVVARLEMTRVADLTLGEDALWVLNAFTDLQGEGLGSVVRVSTETNGVGVTVPVGGAPVAIAAGEGGVWVALAGLGAVARIDPETSVTVATIEVGSGPADIAVGAGSVWVANGGETTVSRIDPDTNEVIATIELGGRPDGIAVGEGAVWVTVY